MHRSLLAAPAILGLLCMLTTSASAHGGRYRGPEDVVPRWAKGHTPKTGNPTTPTAPKPGAPAPGVPITPAPTPVAPGTPRPGSPSRGGNPTTGGRGRALGEDFSKWQYWWEFNKDPFLMLKDAVFAGGSVTGSDAPWMGRGRRSEHFAGLRPTKADIEGTILPNLKRALDSTTNRDIISSCLMALAKIGRNPKGFGLLPTIRRHLRTHQQEIRETTALALGLTTDPRVVPELLALALDKQSGRDAVGHQSVDDRTRSFAAYGLGMVAWANADMNVKRAILEGMTAILDNDSIVDRNIRVAAIAALSLLNLPEQRNEAEEKLLRDALAVLTRFYDKKLGRGSELIQSHVPTAVAKLVRRGNSRRHTALKDRFAADLAVKRRRSADIQRSAALALGQMALPGDSDKKERSYSDRLLSYYARGRDHQARYFCLIALAQIGGDANRNALLTQLRRGKKQMEKPWAALALGTMAFNLRKQDHTEDLVNRIGRTLLAEFEAAKTPYAKGAMAVGLGLSGHREAGRVLRDELAGKKHQDEYAGYVCIGLALMPYQPAATDLLDLVEESLYRPNLLKQAAIALGKMKKRGVKHKLIEMLRNRQSANLAKMSAIANALTFIGDRDTIKPLCKMLHDEELTPLTRAFAAVALGGIADKEKLPWNSKISRHMNYRASVETLTQSGTGVLDIL